VVTLHKSSASKQVASLLKRTPGTPTTMIAKSRGLIPVSRTPTRTPSSEAKLSGKRKRVSSATPVPIASEKEPSAKKQKQSPKCDKPSSPRQTRRRSTFEKPSPSLMDSMKETMTDEELKQSLEATLDRKAKEKGASANSSSTDLSTHIPRFTGLGTKPKKPTTPGNKDWEKVHQKQFDKMPSIDVYLDNRKKRADDLLASVKKMQELKQNMKSALESLKKRKTPPSLKKSATKAKIEKAVKTRTALFQSPYPGVPFVPKVTSTTKMNINFANTDKTPAFCGRGGISTSAKTPAPGTRKSQGVVSRKSVTMSISKENRKSVGKKRDSTLTTPFKFTAGVNNTTLNQSTKKNSAFDLKASLAKPITWKMHAGPLKPVEKNTKTSRETSVKDVKPKTVGDRRKAAMENRAATRHNNQMKHRNLT